VAAGSAVSEAPRTSIVTVTYEAAGFITPFLEALAGQDTDGIEVIIVDNASRDGTADIVARVRPEARLIRTPHNLGFAGGSNLGAAQARGEVLLFLNPDTRPPPGSLAALADRVRSDERVGAAGCKLLFPDGRIQSAGCTLGPNGFADHRGWSEVDRGQYDREEEVDYVPGAALAIRRTLFSDLGGFHEGYFPGFYEDTELCLRLRRRGYRVLYVPTPAVVHLESASMGHRMHHWLHRNRMIFVARNGGVGGARDALACEACFLWRRHLRPLGGAVLRRDPRRFVAETRALGSLVAGVLAGLAAVGRLAGQRRRAPPAP
jgi:GT2 family glycosyltransferase